MLFTCSLQSPRTCFTLLNKVTGRWFSHFWKFYKNMWPCEHIAITPTRALEGACVSEEPWSLGFISLMVNLSLQYPCFKVNYAPL
jgi:hypothetical protein